MTIEAKEAPDVRRTMFEYDSLNIPSFFTPFSTQPSSVDVRTSKTHNVLLVVWPTGNLHQACLLSTQENIVDCLCFVVTDVKNI